MGKRRKFSDEFKREAVVLADQPGVTKAQVGRELGVHANVLTRWSRELRDSGAKAFSGAVHGRWAHWDRVAYRAKYRPISTFLDWSKPQFMCALPPERSCPIPDSNKRLKDFRKVDLNNDSSIDRNEYEANEFRKFDKIDLDKDTLIDLEEWSKIYGR